MTQKKSLLCFTILLTMLSLNKITCTKPVDNIKRNLANCTKSPLGVSGLITLTTVIRHKILSNSNYISKDTQDMLLTIALTNNLYQLSQQQYTKDQDERHVDFGISSSLIQNVQFIVTNGTIRLVANKISETDYCKKIVEKSGYDNAPSWVQTAIKEGGIFVATVAANMALNSLMNHPIDINYDYESTLAYYTRYTGSRN